MGSFCELRFGDYLVHDSKNGVDELCTLLFTESDRIFVRNQSGRIEEYLEGELEDSVFEYEATVRNVVDRLEISGFTLERAKASFDKSLADLLDARADYHLTAREQLSMTDVTDENKKWYQQTSYEQEKDFCSGYTFDKWIESIRELIVQEADSDFDVTEDYAGILPIQHEINESFFLSFPSEDCRYVLRSILELFGKDDYVVLDYGDLVQGGWVNPHEELCHVEPHIIILTEGPTDIDILEPSLYALYPHLYEFYSFMDFRTLNVQANAAALANIVKAFIGARIKEKMIAIFDNDAAATDVLRSLPLDSLPENIKVIQLPNLEFAKNYPTTGPQGTHFTDVNGCACSIEMYLGCDVLTDDNDELIPVRWGSYINGVKRYQGEIEQKKLIQQKYNALLKGIDYAVQVPEHDWSGLESVFQAIFSAYK